MKLKVALAFVLTVMLPTHRLPAPIPEEKVKPTPAPTESSEAKPKHKARHSDDSGSSSSAKSSAPRPSGKAKNLAGPTPQYPPEGKALGLSGRGTYVLHFDQATGLCTEVTVLQSAGSPLLDNAAIAGFRQWHEDPNCAKEVQMTMTFTVTQNPAE